MNYGIGILKRTWSFQRKVLPLWTWLAAFAQLALLLVAPRTDRTRITLATASSTVHLPQSSDEIRTHASCTWAYFLEVFPLIQTQCCLTSAVGRVRQIAARSIVRRTERRGAVFKVSWGSWSIGESWLLQFWSLRGKISSPIAGGGQNSAKIPSELFFASSWKISKLKSFPSAVSGTRHFGHSASYS